MSIVLALGLVCTFYPIFVEHKTPLDVLDIMMVIMGTFITIIAGMAIYELFYRNSALKIDQKGIRLRRKSYSYHIYYQDVKSIILHDSWIFVQQSDNIVRPIDLFPFHYDWQNINETLTTISSNNHFTFVVTDDKKEINKILGEAAELPKEMTYKVKSDKGSNLFLQIGGLMFFAFFFAGIIFVIITTKDYDFLSISIALIMGCICYAYFHIIKKELKRKEYSIELNRTTIAIEGQSFYWDKFESIQAITSNARKDNCIRIYVYVKKGGALEIKNFNAHELAEQFTFFGRRVIQVNDLDKNLI